MRKMDLEYETLCYGCIISSCLWCNLLFGEFTAGQLADKDLLILLFVLESVDTLVFQSVISASLTGKSTQYLCYFLHHKLCKSFVHSHQV